MNVCECVCVCVCPYVRLCSCLWVCPLQKAIALELDKVQWRVFVYIALSVLERRVEIILIYTGLLAFLLFLICPNFGRPCGVVVSYPVRMSE